MIYIPCVKSLELVNKIKNVSLLFKTSKCMKKTELEQINMIRQGGQTVLSDNKNAYLKYKVIQNKERSMPLGSTGVIFGRIWNLNRFLQDKEDFE